jgi:hypothetical protein
MGKFTEFLFANWTHVLPIIIAGVFAVAIILERVKMVFFTYPLAGRSKFYHRIRELVMAD